MENIQPNLTTFSKIKRIVILLDVLENPKLLITSVIIAFGLISIQHWLIFHPIFIPICIYIAIKLSKFVETRWGENNFVKLGILIIYILSILIAFIPPLLLWVYLLIEPIQLNSNNHGSEGGIIILIVFLFVISVLANITTIPFSTLFYLRRKKLQPKEFLLKLLILEFAYILHIVILFILLMHTANGFSPLA